MENNILIEAKHLGFRYDDESAADAPPALADVSLTVRRGEYIAVLGHNGSGKSTLAKLFNMILEPSEGTLSLFGVTVTDDGFSEDDMYELRRHIGMIFQNPDNQLVATVVEEDVAFGPENLALPREEIRRRVNNALSVVGMTEYAHHAPHKLSGGQKQRVAIAGILAMKPRIIIFDESTAMLDPQGRRNIVDIMERLNREEGITILNITHYMEEAVRADRVIVMDDGRIAMDGVPHEVFTEVKTLRSLGLEPPQSLELLFELREAGLAVPTDALGIDECVSALASVIGGNRNV